MIAQSIKKSKVNPNVLDPDNKSLDSQSSGEPLITFVLAKQALLSQRAKNVFCNISVVIFIFKVSELLQRYDIDMKEQVEYRNNSIQIPAIPVRKK